MGLAHARPIITDDIVLFDIEILVPFCSACIALRNGAVRITIAHTVPELREYRYEHPRNDF